MSPEEPVQRETPVCPTVPARWERFVDYDQLMVRASYIGGGRSSPTRRAPTVALAKHEDAVTCHRDARLSSCSEGRIDHAETSHDARMPEMGIKGREVRESVEHGDDRGLWPHRRCNRLDG